ncbi:MAG: PASTA domain-containing protein [Coriobacteriia bacterium]
MRNRPHRAPLVPRWLIISVGAGVLIVVLAVMGIMLAMQSGEVMVPAVAGMNRPDAVTTLQGAGLTMIDGGSRFSMDVPRGAVISQEPSAGATVARGDAVTLIFSAGTEAFPMPDVIGRDATQATKELEQRGLVVATQTVESQLASGTVLETYPSPGAEVSTGSAVRLTVAGRSLGSSILTPYRLTGVAVVVDPVPRGTTPDITLEVARRLRALIEASGGTAVVTRSSSSTATAVADRAALASEATGTTCAVVLDVAQTGSPGLAITTLPGVAAAGSADATSFPQAAVEAVKLAGLTVQPVGTAQDGVLAAVGAPGLRLVLGNSANATDAAHFADPEWADTIARALYRAIGATFGAGQ